MRPFLICPQAPPRRAEAPPPSDAAVLELCDGALLPAAVRIGWEIGLFERLDIPAGELAYAEQRALELGIAIASGAEMILLDEPVAGMNPVETESVMAKLAEIRALGITVLLVEHDMKMVMGVSDRIVCPNYGRIIANGSPAEIRKDPAVIRAYLGERYARAQG